MLSWEFLRRQIRSIELDLNSGETQPELLMFERPPWWQLEIGLDRDLFTITKFPGEIGNLLSLRGVSSSIISSQSMS